MAEQTSSDNSVSILRVVHNRPAISIPSGACDCHVHVFGPTERFPYCASRAYTPAPALVEDLMEHQRILGLDRVVVVQASVYGSDNRCTLDAIARIGSGARGVAVIDEQTSLAELETLARSGISGIRLNLAAASADATAALRALKHANEVATQFGWHIQVFAPIEVVQALRHELKKLDVPLVLDHFAGVHASAGVKSEGFKALLGLLAGGNCHVKVSAPYLVSEQPSQEEVAPLLFGLVSAAPERLLWGSNWPHPLGGIGDITRGPVSMFREIDDGAALQRLAHWLEDDALFNRILVDNPAALYGFNNPA
ncbi:amidohydrolase family protein [Pseudomonas auratipiscis]|uniref:Amidohydrolase family protein n=1 Tax=Pseudomonas auratipiscis TaxID=3115853 RepID=A0AB35WMQ6_9PSED|nr:MULTISPECIES: amidohydrolase family protein [unclassified Pseudomonas]MEE1865870.1 amidohydrolase family protein [Pseudomonas sp. 120P]MEE1956961.1 amidohydrolase family protein [Pseudomonas sp. 119P]